MIVGTPPPVVFGCPLIPKKTMKAIKHYSCFYNEPNYQVFLIMKQPTVYWYQEGSDKDDISFSEMLSLWISIANNDLNFLLLCWLIFIYCSASH